MQVVYEDNHIIIVAKTSGEIVQGDKTGDTPLSELVKQYIKEKYQKPGEVFLGVVHRLDRPVSGLVVFARTSKALARLNRMFAEGEVHKTYWAIVKNRPEQPEGTLTHWLVRNEKQNKSYAYDTEKPNSKKAILKYRMIGSSDYYTLLDTVAYRAPPPDSLSVSQDGVSHQGRPEVRCTAQQPRRLHLAALPPCGVHSPRLEGTDCRRGTFA